MTSPDYSDDPVATARHLIGNVKLFTVQCIGDFVMFEVFDFIDLQEHESKRHTLTTDHLTVSDSNEEDLRLEKTG